MTQIYLLFQDLLCRHVLRDSFVGKGLRVVSDDTSENGISTVYQHECYMVRTYLLNVLQGRRQIILACKELGLLAELRHTRAGGGGTACSSGCMSVQRDGDGVYIWRGWMCTNAGLAGSGIRFADSLKRSLILYEGW